MVPATVPLRPDFVRFFMTSSLKVASNPIQVWHFQDAPDEYRRLCPPKWLEADSEVCPQWVMLRPPPYESTYWIGWAESKEIGSQFHDTYLSDGALLVITALDQFSSHDFTPVEPRDETRVIRVWDYDTAQKQGICGYVDDADWVAILPATLAGAEIPWMASGTNYGCCGVDVDELPDGGERRIGCHA